MDAPLGRSTIRVWPGQANEVAADAHHTRQHFLAVPILDLIPLAEPNIDPDLSGADVRVIKCNLVHDLLVALVMALSMPSSGD